MKLYMLPKSTIPFFPKGNTFSKAQLHRLSSDPQFTYSLLLTSFRNERDLRRLAGRRFDKRPDKFLNCLAVYLHKTEVRGEGARLLCSLGVAALREAAEVKMETKTAEKVSTYCYRNILSRDAVVSL